MDLTKLFNLQKNLDDHIETEHPRKEGESRSSQKVLSLLVELGELANETRCFKFWSNKPASERTIILEEFVDGVHFLLSLGLENGIEEVSIKPNQKDTLTDQFIGLYNVFSLLQVYFTKRTYSEAWSAYIGLGEMLGFEWTEVEAAYLKKNRKNHERQESGY